MQDIEVIVATVIESELYITLENDLGEQTKLLYNIALIKPHESKYFHMKTEASSKDGTQIFIEYEDNSEFLKDQFYKGLCWEEDPDKTPLTGNEDLSPEFMPTFLTLMRKARELDWL